MSLRCRSHGGVDLTLQDGRRLICEWGLET